LSCFNGLAYLPIQPYEVHELRYTINNGKEDVTHPVNDEKFTTNVLASSAGKKKDWTSKVYRVTPSRSWDALSNLAEAHWISQ
jgi:hypothetical protein